MYQLQRENCNEKCQNSDKNCRLIEENNLEQYVDSDLQCLSHLPVGFSLGDRYCRCGKTRSLYQYEFEDFFTQTNVSNFIRGRNGGDLISNDDDGGGGGGGGTNSNNSVSNQFTPNDIFSVDKSAIFLTKKSLVLNQFLEHTNLSASSSSSDAKNMELERTTRHWLKESSLRCGTYISENCKGYKIGAGSANHGTTTSCPNSIVVAGGGGGGGCARSGISDNDGGGGGGGAGAADDAVGNVICATSSTTLLSDKHFVSLLRGITLYWFICLHTVLARGEVFKNRKGPMALAFAGNGDMDNSTMALLGTISWTTTSSTSSTTTTNTTTAAATFPLSCSSTALQMSLSVLENAHCELKDDILWMLFRDTILKENWTATRSNSGTVLPLEHHSRKYLAQNFLRSLLETLFHAWRQSFVILDVPIWHVSGVKTTAIKKYIKIKISRDDNADDDDTENHSNGNENGLVKFVEMSDRHPNIQIPIKSRQVDHTLPVEVKGVEEAAISSSLLLDKVNLQSSNTSSSSTISLDSSYGPTSLPMRSYNSSFASFPLSQDENGTTTTVTSLTDSSDSCSWSSSLSSYADEDSESTAYPDSDFNSDGCWSSRSDEDDDDESQSDDDDGDDECDTDQEDDNDEEEEADDGGYTNAEDGDNPSSNSAPSSECDDHELMNLTDPTSMGHNLQFYLPPGIFSCNERANEYPPYNLWRATFNPMHMLAARIEPDQPAQTTETAASTSTNDIIVPITTTTTTAGELTPPVVTLAVKADDDFTPYRMWDSPAVITIATPNVDENANLTKTVPQNLANVVVVAAAATNDRDLASASQSNLSQISQLQHQLQYDSNLWQGSSSEAAVANSASIYSLWSSQKMVDFHQLAAINPNATNCRGNVVGTAITRDVSDCCCQFLTSCSPSASLVDLVDEPYDLLDPHYREAFAAGFRGSGSNRYGTHKPSTNHKLVSFTDRGAFKYYRKSVNARQLSDATSSLYVDDSYSVANDAGTPAPAPPSPPKVDEKSATAESETGEDEAGDGEASNYIDHARSNDNVDDEDEASELEKLDEATRHALNASYIFRPIQPAFKVQTDAAPALTRSASGAFYQNGRQLLVFEHELDGGSSSKDPYIFQPKYAVLSNHKACQTESTTCEISGFQLVATSPFGRSQQYYEPSNALIISHQYTHFGAAPVGPSQLQRSPPPPISWSTPQHSWLVSSQPLSTPQMWSICSQPVSSSQPWSSAPPPPTLEAQQPLYYSLGDMFDRLGQPGFANVGEYMVNRFS